MFFSGLKDKVQNMPESFKNTMKAYAKPYFGEPLQLETPFDMSRRVFIPWTHLDLPGL